jgi:hypothetical protein
MTGGGEDAVMSLEEAAYLSQIAGVIAVLGSLVFVGLQIRQQTLATKAQTEQAIAANWMALGQLIADHAEAFTAGLVSKNPAFTDLDDANRMRFLTGIFALFKHYENMFLQFERGRVGAEDWEPWSNHIQMYFFQPGVQSWWAIRKSAFAPAFRVFLDAAKKPDEPSPQALHQAHAGGKEPS